VTAAGLERARIVLERSEGTSYAVTLVRAADLDSAVASGATGASPVVIVAPAMGMGARYYEPLLEALAAAGVHAAVAEQRGHEAAGGRLPGRDYDFGYAELVEDLGRAIEAVRTELPGAPVFLLGHSLGGQVAAAYLGAHPGDLAGLIQVGSSSPHWRSWGAKLLLASYAFPLAAAVVGHFPGKHLRFAGREARGVFRDWGILARTGRLPVGDDGLADAAVPVLAVSIEGDDLAPVRAVDAMAARLTSAAVTRVHVDAEGIDHFRWARRADPVVPLIADWLRTVRRCP